MSGAGALALRFARSTPVSALLVGVPIVGIAVVLAAIAVAPGGDRPYLLAAALVAAAAGLSASSIGVFGGVLVPGMLLLGIEPRVAAPLSLLLQVIVIPLGATSHIAVGNVRRSITVPLIAGGVVGSVAGALLASTVPSALATQAVAVVIVVVGLIVLATLRTGYAGGYIDHEEIRPARIGGIGTAAGFASGISGAGWGPIGVKLLILARLDPRHAIGSSLVGRVPMAVAAIVTYTLAAGRLAFEPRLFIVLLAASGSAMMPGTVLIGRLGRRRAAGAIAILSIGLALPSILGAAR